MSWKELFQFQENRWEKPAPIVEVYLERLQNMSCFSGMDYGCGAGRHTIEMLRRGFETYAVDVSSDILDIVKEKTNGIVNGTNLNVTYLLAENLIQEKIKVDFCICVSSIHHNFKDNITADLYQLNTCIREGGFLLVIVPSTLHPTYGSGSEVEKDTYITDKGIDPGIPHHFFTKVELGNLFEETGFEVTEMFDIGAKDLAGINDGHILSFGRKI